MPGFRPSKATAKSGGKSRAGTAAKPSGGCGTGAGGFKPGNTCGHKARSGPVTAPRDMVLDGKLHRAGDPIDRVLYRRAPREMRRAIDEGHPGHPAGPVKQVVAVRHVEPVVARAEGDRTVYSTGVRNPGHFGAVVEGGRAHALSAGRVAFPLRHGPGEEAAHAAARRYAQLKGDRTPAGPEHVVTAKPHGELGGAEKRYGRNPYEPGDFAYSMGHVHEATAAVARDNADRSRRAVRDFRDEAKLAGLDHKIGAGRPANPIEERFVASAIARSKIPVAVTVADRGGKPETERVAVDHLGQVFNKLNRLIVHDDPRLGQRVRVRVLSATVGPVQFPRGGGDPSP